MEALPLAQYGFVPALAAALLHSLWQGALLAAAAALTLRAMARAKAAARHNVAMAFLVAMALAPALQFLRFWRQPGALIDADLLPALTGPRFDTSAHIFVQQSSPLAAAVVLLWLLGLGLMLARHIAGLRAIARMERGPARSLPPRWQQRVDELRSALGIARAVAVRLSDEVLAPCAARLLRPIIWLPLSLLTGTPAAQLEALLAHELAHIARRDWLWNGVQCVIEALFFFHPAIWWLGRRIRQEREHACDDLAVAACGDAIALAEALAALECARRAPPRLALAAQGGSLMQRVARLLAEPPSRGRWGALTILGALTIFGALLIAQVGLAGGRLPDLQVESSTAGALGPGDYREISAGGLDKQRFYRESIDAQGGRTESYRENGQDHPIDAEVRRWLAGIARLSVTQPPPPPAIDAMPDQRSLIASIAADPTVVARLGTPVVRTAAPINGNVRLEGATGDAAIDIQLRGPRGLALVTVDAEMNDHRWVLQSVAVQ
jgi:beta-lactamase regulating signal transducer with metallopeptidase domain